jgi:hypothetical protein
MVSPSELSQNNRDFQARKIVEGFRYQRKIFCGTILRRLMGFGFISKQLRFRGVVYAPVIQPIPRQVPVMTSVELRLPRRREVEKRIRCVKR